MRRNAQIFYEYDVTAAAFQPLFQFSTRNMANEALQKSIAIYPAEGFDPIDKKTLAAHGDGWILFCFPWYEV